MSQTEDLTDAVCCSERLSYSTMRRYFVVMESYEETCDYLLGCYVALVRFHENYVQPTRNVWVNSDADIPMFNEMFGRGKYFLGELRKQDYKWAVKEIRELNGRCVVMKQDWYRAFRDELIMRKA